MALLMRPLRSQTNSLFICSVCETIWSGKGTLTSNGASAFNVIPSEEAGVEPECRGSVKAALFDDASVKQGVYRGQRPSLPQMAPK